MQALNNPIHHIGVATESIEGELPIFQKMGFMIEDSFVDENQGVRGLFITQGNYRLELLENLSSNGPLNTYLKNRTKMYHIAYESQNIQRDLEILRMKDFARGGGIIVKPIMPAVCFKKLCFVMMKNHILVELVEKR